MYPSLSEGTALAPTGTQAVRDTPPAADGLAGGGRDTTEDEGSDDEDDVCCWDLIDSSSSDGDDENGIKTAIPDSELTSKQLSRRVERRSQRV